MHSALRLRSVVALLLMAFDLAATIQAFPIPITQPATSTTEEGVAPQHAKHWWDAASVSPVIMTLFIFDLIIGVALGLWWFERGHDGREMHVEEYEMTTMFGAGGWVQ